MSAAAPQAINFEKKETTQVRMVYPQVIPLFRRPRFVRRPERVKY